MSWIPNHWTFKDEAVAARFDAHVRETLPWYDLATHGVAHLVRSYLPEGGHVIDIGASTGNIGRAIADTLEARHASLDAYEPSPNMAALYNAPGNIHTADITDAPIPEFDIAVAFLVLMFIPPPKRPELIRTLIQRCRPGGAIIIVEKTALPPGYLGSTIHRWTMSQKLLGGITHDEIAAKELSLSGSLRPINSQAMTAHQFTPWLQVGEFTGWVHEHPPHL